MYGRDDPRGVEAIYGLREGDGLRQQLGRGLADEAGRGRTAPSTAHAQRKWFVDENDAAVFDRAMTCEIHEMRGSMQ